jgi:hypothetical protein
MKSKSRAWTGGFEMSLVIPADVDAAFSECSWDS